MPLLRKLPLNHSVYYLVGSGIQSLSLFLVTPFITRALGETEYGRVVITLSIMTAVLSALAAGISQVIVRDYGSGPETIPQARLAVGWVVATGAALAVLGIVAPPLLAFSGFYGDQAIARAVFVGIGANLCIAGGSAVLRGTHRALGFAALAISTPLIPMLIGLVATQSRADASTYLAAYTITLCVIAIISVLIGKPSFPWVNRLLAKRILLSTLPLVPATLATSLMLTGDTILVGMLLGPNSAAVYQPAMVIGGITVTVGGAIYNAWGPAVYRRSQNERWGWSANATVTVCSLLGLLAAFIAFTSQWIIPLYLAPDFDIPTVIGLSSIVPWLAIGWMAANNAALVLIDHGKTSLLAKCNVGTVCLFLVLSLVAIQFRSLVLVALARVFTQFLSWLIISRFATKLEPNFHFPALNTLLLLLGVSLGITASLVPGNLYRNLLLIIAVLVFGAITIISRKQITSQ